VSRQNFLRTYRRGRGRGLEIIRADADIPLHFSAAPALAFRAAEKHGASTPSGLYRTGLK